MRELDLADIQGGILRAYGRQGSKARYAFMTIHDGAEGRRFVEALLPRVTTAARWVDPKRGEPLLRTRHPRVIDGSARQRGDHPGEIRLVNGKAFRIGDFTFFGLLALGTPMRTLARTSS